MRLRPLPLIAIILAMAVLCALSWADEQTPGDDGNPSEQISNQQITPPGETTDAPPAVDLQPGMASPEIGTKPDAESDPHSQPEQLPSETPVASGNGEGPGSMPHRRPVDAVSADHKESSAASEQEALPLVEEPVIEPNEVGWILEPEFTRSLTPIRAGHNDSNPLWSPSGDMLAYERSIGEQRKIIIALQDGTIIKTIYFQMPEEEGAMDFFFPGITNTASYNAGKSWSSDGSRLVFMSNGGSGNYDLYLLPDLLKGLPLRLTHHSGKESHPHWSPTHNRLVLVSGSTGKADIFTMDLSTRRLSQVTRGKKMYLYPQWSPDGTKIAMIYGSNENHDIVVMENVGLPGKSTRALTTWAYDDLRPVWSPDGNKIAFYSNYNIQGDQKLWCIIVVAADGSDISEGDALSANVVAHQVIPDIEQGPAWMPDSRHIVYVKNDEQTFNPIYLVDIDEKTPIAVRTQTRMNHDVTCSRDGKLAFRAQVEQWDHIYISKINPEMAALEEIK